MLESTIQKKGVPGEGVPTEQDMETINKFTRRKLTAQEVYVFPVVLCDNEIDRDGERFTTRALHTLSGLFVGKTGIFDHNPKGHNQTARIFETAVEEDPERTTCAGEPYRRLKARAYMVRTKANADLILEIDGGIKKEVSVGCAVAKAACSVCGKDPRHDPCGHRPGETYGEVKCCVELDEPTDAYEWSFVAVPAQVGAGVVKSYREREGVLPPRSREEVLAAVEKGAAYLTGPEAGELSALIRELEKNARAGEAYLGRLRQDAVRLGYLADCGIPAGVLQSAVQGMDAQALDQMCKAFSKKLDGRETCQLLPEEQNENEARNAPFQI